LTSPSASRAALSAFVEWDTTRALVGFPAALLEGARSLRITLRDILASEDPTHVTWALVGGVGLLTEAPSGASGSERLR